MYSPVTLHATNLMSYGELKIDFEEGASLIYGINNCDEGQSGNGSGKSVAMEALAIILLGKSMRPDTVVRDLISRGEEAMKVALYLENPMLNTALQISRTFHEKRSQQAAIYEGKIGEELQLINTTDARHVDNTILEYLDISREDLMNYYLIDKMRFQSFFSGGDAAKKKVIGRFSNIELLDPAFTQIKENLKGYENQLIEKDKEIARNEGSIETYRETLEAEEKRDLKKEQADIVERIKREIEAEEETLSKKEKARQELEAIIKPNQEKLQGLKTRLSTGETMIGDADKTIKEIKADIEESKEYLDEIKDKRAEGNRLLIGKVECPECQHEFNASDPTKDLQKVRDGIAKLDGLEKEEKEVKDNFESELSAAEESKEHLEKIKKEVNGEIEGIERVLRNANSDIEQSKKDEEKKREGIKELKENLATAEKEEITSVVKSIKDAIKTKEEENESLDKEKETISNSIDKENKLQEHFTRFKSQLVNKTIGVIQFYTNKYLESMKSSLTVTISGYKTNRSGGISEKISTVVNRDGVEVGSIGPFSQGERGRIDIAGILALQSQINAKSTSGGLNLLFLDEIIESIDEEGITGILQSLDELGKYIYLVTHSKYEGNHERVIEVIKDKTGQSRWTKK